MSELIRYKNGVTIEVVSPKDRAIPVKESAVEKIESTFEVVLEKLEPFVAPLATFFEHGPASLQTVEVKIGVGFSAEGSLFITKAQAEANLEMKLVFKRSPAGTP